MGTVGAGVAAPVVRTGEEATRGGRTTQGEPNPDAVARHAAAAQQAQRDGDFATAVRELTALARLLPDRAEVHSNLGIARFFSHQPREALTAFDRALTLDPKLVAALIFSGIAQHQLSRPARAIPLLERAVALKPADPLAHTFLAHCYAAQSRYQEALTHFRIAAERAPRDVDVWYGLGQVYLQLGREAVAKLATIAPDGARIAQLSGDLWLLREQPGNALALYEKALQRRPDLPEVREAVERLRARTPAGSAGSAPDAGSPGAPAGVSSGAAPTSVPAPASASPANASPSRAGASEDALYAAATDYRTRAHAAFEKLSAIDPDSYRAHQVLADSLAAQEREEEAIAAYRTVLAKKPDVAGVQLTIGNLLMSEGRAADAVEAYREELRVRPDAAEAHYRLGRALIVLGQSDAAEAALRRALSLDDPPLAARRELGRLFLTGKRPADAARALTDYVAATPDDAAAHYLLMQAYRALGDHAAADRHVAIYERLSAREKQAAALEEALSLFSGNKPRP